MNSLGFTFSALCIFFTLHSFCSAGDRTGRRQDDKGNNFMYFPVSADATITKSGEIKVPVTKISFKSDQPFSAVPSTFQKITDAPSWLEFPFVDSTTSTDYYYVPFRCILTTTKVEAVAKNPCHWDFTFKLIKEFLVDSQNPLNQYEIFVTDPSSVTETVFGIGIPVLNKGSRWNLTDQNKKPLRDVIIGETFLNYLSPDDPQQTEFTLISLTKAE